MKSSANNWFIIVGVAAIGLVIIFMAAFYYQLTPGISTGVGISDINSDINSDEPWMFFTPKYSEVSVGDIIAFDVKISSSAEIQGVAATVSYDPNMFTFVSLDTKNTVFDLIIPSQTDTSVSISSVFSEAAKQVTDQKIATISLRAKKAGDTEIRFETANNASAYATAKGAGTAFTAVDSMTLTISE